MTLLNDFARCSGTTHATCTHCRRRDFIFGQFDTWIIFPTIDMLTGHCSDFIEPPRTYASDSTVPNAELTGRAACGEGPR